MPYQENIKSTVKSKLRNPDAICLFKRIHGHSSYHEDDCPVRYDATKFASRVPVHVAQVVGTDARGDEVAVLLALVRLHLCRFTTKVGLAELCGIGIDFGSPFPGHMRCHSLVI